MKTASENIKDKLSVVYYGYLILMLKQFIQLRIAARCIKEGSGFYVFREITTGAFAVFGLGLPLFMVLIPVIIFIFVIKDFILNGKKAFRKNIICESALLVNVAALPVVAMEVMVDYSYIAVSFIIECGKIFAGTMCD